LGQTKLKNLSVIGCFVASAILLTVIQPPFGAGFLAWLALVPFVIGCLISEKIRPTVLAAYIISLCYWLGNLYWLYPITIPGWFLFCVYMAAYWPILAICLRYCVQRRVPLWFSLPILIVGAEAFQGLCFRGFGWRYLGHSQYENITIIQIADIFGAAGVSFLIAMVNGLIADVIINLKNKRFLKPANFTGIFLTLLAVSAAILYGRYRINQTADFLQAGPRIGVVQSNVPVEAATEAEPAEQTFLNLLIDSRDCLIKAEPVLIIWPETMVEAVLDDSYLKLVPEDDTAKIFHSALRRHSSEGVYLLVGAFAGDAEKVDDKIKMKTSFNSVFLYEPNQTGARQYYNKIHLVPFGEYIPFKNTLPFLNRFLMALTPYDYDYTINAGDEYTVFKMQGADGTYRFGVMICYEDTVPKIARKLVLDKNKNKQIDWLVNISNDGWFVRQEKEKIKPTVELQQHMAICVFRAVENRVPVIRSVNTGISCYIDSLGRIHNDYIAGTVAKQAADRAGQKGWFVDQVLIDKRVTIFSQIGQTLEISGAVCLIFAAFVSIYKLVVGRQ
jgi:apolipoprotein N-acyltransferase